MIVKEMPSRTWAELRVVSDIMGQRRFLIPARSLTLGQLTVSNTVGSVSP